MLEYLSEWMKQIAYYMVLVTLVMQLAAGKSFQKYIRMFTGIVLVLFILSPAARLLSLDVTEMIDSVKDRYDGKLREIETVWSENFDEKESGYTDHDRISGSIEVEEIRIGR